MVQCVCIFVCVCGLVWGSWANAQEHTPISQQHPAIQAYSEASFAFRNRQYHKALPLFQLAERLAPRQTSWQRFRVEQVRYRALCRLYMQGVDNLKQAYRLFSRFLGESQALNHIISLQKSRDKSHIFQESIAQQLVQIFLRRGDKFFQKRQWDLSLLQSQEALIWVKRYKHSEAQRKGILWQILKARVERNTPKDRHWARNWIEQRERLTAWHGYRARLLEQKERVYLREGEYSIEQGRRWFVSKRWDESLRHFGQARDWLKDLKHRSARSLRFSLWYWEARCLLAGKEDTKGSEARRKLRQYLGQREHLLWHRQARELLWRYEQRERQRLEQQRQYRRKTLVGWSLLGSGLLLAAVGGVFAGISVFHAQQSAVAAINPDSPADAITEPHRWATIEGITGGSMLGAGGITMAVGMGLLLSRPQQVSLPKPPKVGKNSITKHFQRSLFCWGEDHAGSCD